MNILEVEDLHKSFKKGFIPKTYNVLKGVSFTIPKGTITGFLGGNGAGKTTTMKCVLGLALPDKGEIRFFGDSELSTEVKAKVGFLPERPYFYDYLTGEEFLKFYGEISGKFKSQFDLKARIDYLIKKVDLQHARDRSLKGYSKGMLQKIGLAQALIHYPEFVILDEPMAGLDPDGRHYLSELISETAKQGTSIFFSSHLLNDTEKLCENLVILRDGVVQFSGGTQTFLGQMGRTSHIKYQGDSMIESVEVENGEPLQMKIDELRKASRTIISVSPNITSLEDAFVGFAMDKKRENL
ncbi:MAG: phosphonate ABC transporter ATP-binding protein [Bdellovibrionaceae bacterium]|nr:phosphonate ABC transporter ATP-binding protein [Pseudobdellovibrionaceae bacterium]|tara:strand:- start:13431 stop:14321 length:891 start_codon:yes stop_codon:yes gene_type:complete